MDEVLGALCAGLRERFPEHVSEPEEAFGEVSVRVAREGIVEVCSALRDRGPFEVLADVSAVDFLGVAPPEDRFLIAYHLLSLVRNVRLRLRVFVPEGDERIRTVTGVWETANWQEREIYDLMGVNFEGHSDLRRLLMPEDWIGHPARKDFVEPEEYHGISTRRESLLR